MKPCCKKSTITKARPRTQRAPSTHTIYTIRRISHVHGGYWEEDVCAKEDLEKDHGDREVWWGGFSGYTSIESTLQSNVCLLSGCNSERFPNPTWKLATLMLTVFFHVLSYDEKVLIQHKIQQSFWN